MSKPHVILIPFPAQGHVIPMLELAHHLVKHEIKVTFVNTEVNHQRVMESLSQSGDNTPEMVDMVSISDGMEPWEDRNDRKKKAESLFMTIPGEIEKLIERINGKEGERETTVCLVIDLNLAGVFVMAERLGFKRAAFWTAPTAMLVLGLGIPKLIKDGIIDDEGKTLKNQKIQLPLDVPILSSTNIPWPSVGDESLQKLFFHIMTKYNHSIKLIDWIICNSSLDLEPEAFSQSPKSVPIGPLLASNRLGRSIGHFWLEDSSCLPWLDQQKPNSVVYVAFGSLTVFNQTQFKELALGLELTGRPFLWVVRQEITVDVNNSYPKGFKERLRDRGRIVGWSPQQQVLSHPSIACFISHCGWNSTIESISNSVPLLCWPYFADQFINEAYICDEWKVGLRLDKDGNGIIGQLEIKDKVERLLRDNRYKERATSLRTKVMDSMGKGQSCKNLNLFVEWIKNTLIKM